MQMLLNGKITFEVIRDRFMQKDYIKRIVEQVVQMISTIFLLRKSGDYKEAREHVKITANNLSEQFLL